MRKYNLVRFLLFIITIINPALVLSDNSVSSSYLISTPNASDIGRFGMYPVSYFYGAANISVPIYSSNCLGVPLDVKLQYDATGVRVNRLPGWTGTSWRLISGGAIVREQRGREDEYSYFSHYDSILSYVGKFDSEIMNFMSAASSQDLQPDIFHFNFLGISGYFLLGNDGKWKIFSNRNVKVLLDYNDGKNYSSPEFDRDQSGWSSKISIKGFTLVDEAGTKYIFGASSELHEHTSCEPIEYTIPFKSIGNEEKQMFWIANCWYLSSVVDRSGTMIYKFEYERGPFMFQIYNNYRLKSISYQACEKYDYYKSFQYAKELYAQEVFDKEGRALNGVELEYFDQKESQYKQWCQTSQFKEWSDDNFEFPYVSSLTSPVYLKNISCVNGDTLTFTTGCQDNLRTDKTLYSSIYSKISDLFKKDDYLYPRNANNKKKNVFTYLEDSTYCKYWYGQTWDKLNPLIRTGILKLTEIKITSGENNSGQIIHFNYNSGDIWQYEGRKKESKRLFLSSIIKTCFKSGKMNDSSAQTYEFSYNEEDLLPHDYLSVETDHLGLFNGNKTSYDSIFSIKLRSQEAYNKVYSLLNMKSKVNSTMCLKGMLNKIVYPTGGCTHFTYEVNDYAIYSDNEECPVANTRIFGGVRIENMCSYLDTLCTQKSEEKTYKYEFGERGHYGDRGFSFILNPKTYDYDWDFHDGMATMRVMESNYTKYTPISNDYGSDFGYGRVTELIKDYQSGTDIRNVYCYSNLNTNKLMEEDLPPIFTTENEYGTRTCYSQLAFARGKLVQFEKYEGTDLVYRKRHEYRSDSAMFDNYVIISDCDMHTIPYVAEHNMDMPMLYYTGNVYKQFYPRFDIVKTTETYYDDKGTVASDLVTTYNNFDYGQFRLPRSVTKKWNASVHNSDAQTEQKMDYTYAFDYFVTSKPLDNGGGQSSSHSGQTQQYEDPRPQWMKDQGLYYYLEMPDWVPVIDVKQGVIYMLADDVNSAASLSKKDGWRYVSLWQVVCEQDWSQATIDSVWTVLKLRKERSDFEIDSIACAEARQRDSIRIQREENALRSISNDLLAEEIQEQQAMLQSKHFYPVVNTVTYYNNVKVGESQTRYKDYSGIIMPCVSAQALGDSITSYEKYLDYNEFGLPTKIQQKGKPCTYLFWDKTKLMAMATSGDTAIVPTYTEGIDPLTSVQYGNYAAYEAPQTQTKVVRYDADNRIKSITDEMGLTQYYDYDGFGRLASVRDKDHRRTASYSYHVQEDGFNYVKTGTLLNAGGTDSLLSIQYYDGLGRPSLTASNVANPQKKFAYALTEYDSFGRESKVWSPVIGATSPDGGMAEDFSSKSNSQYNDAYGYAKTEYDALGRVVKTTRPGKDWHTKGKSVKIAYGFNGTKDVKKYDLTGNYAALTYGYYVKGDLRSTTTEDEDGQKVVVYKDCRDLTVLERRYNGDETIETYYVYNDLGQLVWVLQPKYQKEANVDKFAFYYAYDSKGRVSQKTIPGCQPVKYWYDEAGRVIKMQDGELRVKGKYRKYEYDGLGRLVRQGLSNTGTNIQYDEIVNFYDNYDFLNDSKYSSMTKPDVMSQLTYQAKANAHGQLTGVWQKASNGEELLTAMAYDGYGRLAKKLDVGLGKNVTMTSTSYNFVGDVTGDGVTYYAYDAKTDYLSPTVYASTTNKYDIPHTKLLGSTLYSILDITTGLYPVNGDTLQSFTYDDFGRVVRNNRNGVKGDMTYKYDNLHGWLTNVKAGCGFEQNLYREKGGQNPMYNGSISAMSWKSPSSDKIRRYDYTYDGLNRLTDAIYSEKGSGIGMGMTAAMNLIPNNTSQYFANNLYTESVSYDVNSNIETLQRYGMLNDKSYGLIDDLSVEYNGNQRKSVEDDSKAKLTYSDAFDFVDGSSLSVEYMYDANGALTKDENRGIKNIRYDLLGNPSEIKMKDGNSVEYVYAADGTLLKTTHVTKYSANNYYRREKLYRGSFVFDYGETKKPYTILFPGGFYFYDDLTYIQNYYVQDYQGNNRVVVLNNGGNSYITTQTHYYPYGGIISDLSTSSNNHYSNGCDYKYSGKELDRQFGLDRYDFHARQYDLGVPTFDRPDPMAEKYYSISPYVYCAGDPVNSIDPDGMDVINVSWDEENGKWNIDKKWIGGDNDVYSVTKGDYWCLYSFSSEADISVLQLEDNGIGTIGVMNVKGLEDGCCFVITPTGEPSAVAKSGTSIPNGMYELTEHKGAKWDCLGPVVKANPKAVDRCCLIHYLGNGVDSYRVFNFKNPDYSWTHGCYVVGKDYEIKVDQDGKMNIYVNSKSSLELYKNIQSHFGGTEYLGYYKNRTFFSFPAGSRGKLQQQSLY